METTGTTGSIAAYFEDHSNAEQAVQALRDAGFSSAHIGVAHRGSDNAASSTTAKAGEKATGMWDKVKNFFEGESAEPYADEQSSGDLATREITSSSYTADAPQDGLSTHLTGLSVPEDRSRYLGHRFDSADNGAVVTVNGGSRVSDAEAILVRFGGDIGDNAADYDYSAASATPARDTKTAEGSQNIQLLGEMMRVHKEKVSQGEVSFRKEVITENQTIQVPVTREELVIERHSVDGSTPASGAIGDTGEIRIPLSQEVASVDKSTVVREEVTIGKRNVEEVRDLSGDVRHEELVVNDETQKAPTR